MVTVFRFLQLSEIKLLYGVKRLHVCVDMQDHLDIHLATGLRPLLKVMKASVILVLGEYRRVDCKGRPHRLPKLNTNNRLGK